MHAKIVWLLVVLYVALRGGLYVAQVRGDRSEESRARAERYFSPEEIERGATYARRGIVVRVLRTALDLALIIVLLQTGWFARLSDAFRGPTGDRWYLHAPAAAALFAVALSIIHLPFGFYLGYVLEHRFGMSNLSVPGWLLLQAKHVLVLLPIAAIAAILWFGLLRLFPRGWVAVVPVAILGLQVLMAWILPIVLLPLYHTASPLPEGAFRDRIVAVLRKAGIQAKDVFVIDESRYSRHTNAFFAGIGPTKSIYLYDTLVEDHSEEETLTVVAHEAGHWQGRHILKGMAISFLSVIAGCVLLHLLYPSLERSLGPGWRALADPASIPALLLLAMLAGFFTAPISSAISRRFEREADRAAIDLTGNRAAFAEAEKRIVRTNRADVLPHPLVVLWYASHPPALERIETALGGSGRTLAD